MKQRGTLTLVLAGLAFVFTVYLGMWNNDRHTGTGSCENMTSTYGSELAQDNCRAESEDRNLMYGAGAVAVALLVVGLVRRYQPSGGRAE